MANLYFLGQGVPSDLTQAAYWLKEAANHGRVEAEITLSSAYYTGLFGVPRDMTQGAAWLEKAAVQGSAKAQQELALAYQTGRTGVPRDDAKALYWMKKSIFLVVDLLRLRSYCCVGQQIFHPIQSLRIIPRHSCPAGLVRECELLLRLGRALHSSLFQPRGALGHVTRHAEQAGVISATEVI